MQPVLSPRARHIAATLALATLAAGCAFTRSNVKSLRDDDASRIQMNPTVTTIAALNRIPSHCGLTRDHRVRDEEFYVYEVIGRIDRVKREPDRDIHIVLEDPGDPRARLVVESDDPTFRGNVLSPYHDRLVAARDMFEQLVKQRGVKDFKDLRGTVVRVTGVGFFDLNHFQAGRSRSCIELHPILGIELVTPTSPTHAPNDPKAIVR